jgi:type IV secretory pathway TraG/TraD family ATPase VirD4
MSRIIGPRAPFAAGNALSAWIVLAACWAVAALVALAWVAAHIAVAIRGGHVPPLSAQWADNLARLRTRQTWPGAPTALVAGIWAGLAVAGTAGPALGWHLVVARLPQHDDPAAALRHNPGLAPLTSRPSAESARRLRPSLEDIRPRRIAPGDVGLFLGNLQQHRGTGPGIWASWEDTVLAFMAPRSGKTTALSIPYVLSAPGAAIATSIKADLWAATAQLRGEAGEQVWLFDPQRITGQPQTWFWDPLRDVRTVEAAHRMAAHFVLTVDDGRQKDLWGPAAQELLAALVLAAAFSGRSMQGVARWLDDAASPTPAEILDDHFPALASALRGTQHGAPETRDGIYQTARTAAACLHDEQIMSWVTPPAGQDMPGFSAADFVRSRGTLYLLSEARAAASPLIAAMTDTVMRAGRRQAELAGGRLDPPMVLVLDEAANICRIADLPDLYSHLGSRGMIPVTILQSYMQGVAVWGDPGMAALWGAATRKLIGAGTDDPRLARDLATLVGQHDIPVRSATHGDGRASEQISLRRQDILAPDAIRALRPGTALLLATGARPALIELRRWYQSPDAARIASSIRHAENSMRTAARQAAAVTARERQPVSTSPGDRTAP